MCICGLHLDMKRIPYSLEATSRKVRLPVVLRALGYDLFVCTLPSVNRCCQMKFCMIRIMGDILRLKLMLIASLSILPTHRCS